MIVAIDGERWRQPLLFPRLLIRLAAADGGRLACMHACFSVGVTVECENGHISRLREIARVAAHVKVQI